MTTEVKKPVKDLSPKEQHVNMQIEVFYTRQEVNSIYYSEYLRQRLR